MQKEMVVSENSSAKLFEWSLGLLSFLIVALPKLSPIGIFVLVFVTVFLYIKKQASWKLNWTSVYFILLYLTYIVGIVYSHDKSIGYRYAEYKMGLFVLPLILAVRPTFKFNLRTPIIGLFAGIFIVIILGLINSFDCYSEQVHSFSACFTSSTFSSIHHPSYFSGFILFSIVAFYYGKRNSWKGFSLINFVVYFFIAISAYFLSLSLAGILFLGMLFISLSIYLFIRKFGVKWFIPSSIIVVVFSVLFISNIPVLKTDIAETKTSYKRFLTDSQAFLRSKSEGAYCTGNEVRMIMWTISAEIFWEHPFGVGTGNTDEYLETKLRKYGIDHLVEFWYNPHNQYLQTAVEVGVVGLLLFLLIIGSALWFAWKNKSYLLFILVAGLAFNCLFESMFQRQSGLVFHAFWIPLIILSINNTKQFVDND